MPVTSGTCQPTLWVLRHRPLRVRDMGLILREDPLPWLEKSLKANGCLGAAAMDFWYLLVTMRRQWYENCLIRADMAPTSKPEDKGDEMETMTSGSALIPEASNARIADLLEHIADLLERQDANPFRIRAYRTAAQYVRFAEDSLVDLVSQGGHAALESLPHIGEGLAATIGEFVRTGQSSLLERLQEHASSEDVLRRVPGIGAELAAGLAEAGYQTAIVRAE